MPIVPLMVLVILGGLLLGGLLTKFFGGGTVRAPSAQPSFTPLPESAARVTPLPSALPALVPRVARTSPRPSSSAAASPTPTASPAPKPSPARTHLAVNPAGSPTPPIIILTPNPAQTQPVSAVSQEPPAQPTAAAATPTPVLITGANTSEHAAAIVRAYIDALARGDSATAAGYLASGLPTETFVNQNVSVSLNDVQSTRNDDGSFTVTTQIVTSKGTYVESFALRPSPLGMQITDHSATHI